MPANVQVSCMPIERTLREPIGLGCAVGAPQLGLRAMAWSRTRDLDGGVRWSSEPWAGYTASADCASGMSGEQICTKRSCRLPARSSVGGMSRGFVRRTYYTNGSFSAKESAASSAIFIPELPDKTEAIMCVGVRSDWCPAQVFSRNADLVGCDYVLKGALLP